MDQLFPGLEVTEIIGAGGMGAVYKALQLRLERYVAIKILPAELGSDEEFVARFEREAKAMAALNHPSIVSIFDFGETAPLPAAPAGQRYCYFVMEFVEGASLHQMIAGGDLTPEHAMAIVPKICEALQFAHDRGIIHRDIKPANILVDREGNVKIADFGLAKLSGGGVENLSLTMTNTTMGTPLYMAPEQFESTGKVDHRADIYSLGVVFYQMLTGTTPQGAWAPPSKKVEGVDRRIDEVVNRAMQQEPGDRYQQASEINTDITRIGSEPPDQRPKLNVGAPAVKRDAALKDERPVPVKRRNQTAKWTVALAVVAAMAVGAFLLLRDWEPEPSDPPESAPFPESNPAGTVFHVTVDGGGDTHTLDEALAAAKPGDTVSIEESYVTNRLEPAVIATSGITLKGNRNRLTFGVLIEPAADDVTIDSLEAFSFWTTSKGPNKGPDAQQVANLRLVNCRAMFFRPDTGTEATLENCCFTLTGGYRSRITANHCTFNPGNSRGNSINEWYPLSTYAFENCIVAGQDVVFRSGVPDPEQFTFRNCLLHAGGGSRFRWYEVFESGFDATSGQFTDRPLSELAAAGFETADSVFDVDPRFVNPDGDFNFRDFNLTPGSPAIGAASDGKDLGAIPDADGWPLRGLK